MQPLHVHVIMDFDLHDADRETQTCRCGASRIITRRNGRYLIGAWNNAAAAAVPQELLN